jgi:hypothetical protein
MTSYRNGGYLKDIPRPHFRMFGPIGRKWPQHIPRYRKLRELHISVYQYAGFPHYFVTLRQEDNYIWDTRREDTDPPDFKGRWHKAWDDKRGEGKTIHSGELNNRLEVNAFIKKHVRRFPRHKIRWDGWSRKLYMYYRQGD